MSVYVVLGVEFDFDIGFCVAPQKPGKNWEKHDVRTFFFRGMSAPIFFATDPLHEPSRKFFAIFLARARAPNMHCVSWRLIVILARFWEAPGVPKINKKLKKSRSGRFRDFKSILGAILKRFSRILERFWIDFGWISEGFGKNLGKMLGAFWKDKGA